MLYVNSLIAISQLRGYPVGGLDKYSRSPVMPVRKITASLSSHTFLPYLSVDKWDLEYLKANHDQTSHFHN